MPSFLPDGVSLLDQSSQKVLLNAEELFVNVIPRLGIIPEGRVEGILLAREQAVRLRYLLGRLFGLRFARMLSHLEQSKEWTSRRSCSGVGPVGRQKSVHFELFSRRHG